MIPKSIRSKGELKEQHRPLKNIMNEEIPRRNRLRQQRDDAMEESNKVRKENAKLRMMLKENDELKRKYEELQKRGRVFFLKVISPMIINHQVMRYLK